MSRDTGNHDVIGGAQSEDAKRRLEELWVRFVAHDQLAADERAQLVSALERDEIFRRRMINDLQLDGALRAAGEIERGQEHVVAAVKALVTAAGRTEEVVAAVRRQIEAKAATRADAALGARSPRGRAGRGLAAAVLFAAAAAALLMLRPRVGPVPSAAPPLAQTDRDGAGGAAASPQEGPNAGPRRASLRALPPAGEPAVRAVIAQLEALEGPVYRHGADGTLRVAAVINLGAGDWISTAGAGARARLSGPAGSRIELGGDAVAGLSADATEAGAVRLFVAHGRANAVIPAAAGGPALILASPHAIVTGTGTVHLDVGTALTRVEVKEGRARVSALGVQRGTEVEAGQMALVSADDIQPPRALTAREVLLLTGPDDTKEEPAPPGSLRGSEERLKTRLERLGFEVTVVEAATLTLDRARTSALMVLSSSVASNLLEPWFADVPVPMLVLESTGFEQLGFTGSRWLRDVGPTVPLAEIVITNPGHAMAAGLTGTIRVLNAPVKLRWGAPLPGAVSIATYPGAPEQASLMFGYERGAATVSGPAPARRVGMFLGNGRVIRGLTEPGWRLFDAAVTWATGG